MTKEQAARILDPETREDALAEIEYYGGFRGEEAVKAAMDEACRIAAAELRNKPTGEPLTLEQLRGMVGQPVWVELLKEPERSCWEIVKFYDEPMILGFTDGKYCDARAYGDLWLAYAYPPAHIDREA